VLAIEERQDLDRERIELLQFQERIDSAREQLESDDLTKRDIELIGDELDASMPVIVRRSLPGYQEAVVPDARSDFAAVASPGTSEAPDLRRDLQNLMQ
jgi:hypothetical protein